MDMRVSSTFRNGLSRDAAMRERLLRPAIGMSLILAGLVAPLVASLPQLCAQTPGSGAGQNRQNQPAGQTQNPPGTQNTPAAQNLPAARQPARGQTQSNSNPFPEDTDSVPVIPTKAPGLPPGVGDDAGSRMTLPTEDLDPVRSPEEAGAAAEQQEYSSSSSLAGMGSLLPGPDDDTEQGKRNRKGQQIVPEHHETAAEDENVGSYYLDNKDWKAALSRYQSALVLDPDNPDVYWGLAESERHTGDFADARANYRKVMEYDPGSHHAKEARKALEDPQIANAKPPAQPSTPPQ